MSTQTPEGVRRGGETALGGAAILAGFARSLAAVGIARSPDRTASFLTAAATLGAADPRAIYWAGRCTLLSEPDEIAAYDRAFASYFSKSGHRLRHQPRNVQVTLPMPAADPAVDDQPGTQPDEDDVPVVRARASARDILRQRDFAKLSNAEREEMHAMLALLRPGLPTRRSRRRRPYAHGAIDRARTLRAMLAAGGELPGLSRRKAGRRPRRLVLLIDVSGSMSPYADPLLRFAHVLVRHQPTAVEVFTIGTRLSRVTRALTQRDPDQALSAASAVIPDYSGGTRLGEVLKAFNDRWGQRGTAHGAVVLIFSDGWERGSCDLLAEQTARVHRLARQVVWVNPHKGHEGYLPVQSGIVAALPHVDRFVAGHSLATLEELLKGIRDA